MITSHNHSAFTVSALERYVAAKPLRQGQIEESTTVAFGLPLLSSGTEPQAEAPDFGTLVQLE